MCVTVDFAETRIKRAILTMNADRDPTPRLGYGPSCMPEYSEYPRGIVVPEFTPTRADLDCYLDDLIWLRGLPDPAEITIYGRAFEMTFATLGEMLNCTRQNAARIYKAGIWSVTLAARNDGRLRTNLAQNCRSESGAGATTHP